MPPDYDLFLSYNSEDRPVVREVAVRLTALGYKTWLDVDDLIPGRLWQVEAERVIGRCRAAAVFVGQSGIGPWEQEEMLALLSQAVKRKAPVIPVLLPGAPLKADVPLFLGQRTWVDLRQGITEQGLNSLIWGITGEKPGKRPRADVLTSADLEASASSTELRVGTASLPGDRLPLRAFACISSLFLLFGIWVCRHFFVWYSQKVGDTAGILSAIIPPLCLVLAGLRILMGEDDTRRVGRDLLRKLDRSPRTIPLSILGIMFLLILLALSSSVYVQLEKDLSKDVQKPQAFSVELREKGVALWPAADISREEPLFFRFRLSWRLLGRSLTLHILRPALYHSIEKTVSVGGSIHFVVPPPKEEYYALRIVPGRGLYHNLTPASSSESSLYDLQVRVGTSQPRIVNLTKAMLYIGSGGEEDLKLEAQKQPDGEWKPGFCRYLQDSLPGTGGCESHPLLTDPRYEPFAFVQGDTIYFQILHSIRSQVPQNSAPIPTTPHSYKAARPGIATVYLEGR